MSASPGWWKQRRGLYAIVDPDHCAGRPPTEMAEAILHGGCAALQLRNKRGDDSATLKLARSIAERCHKAGVPFVVNDRTDLAMLAGADGVHLGQDDIDPNVARGISTIACIGVSTHNTDQVTNAIQNGADLIGFGPVFATQTKNNPDPSVGVEGLRRVVQHCPIPVVAIGGINLERLPSVLATGVALVATISAVSGADDPSAAARAFHTQIVGT